MKVGDEVCYRDDWRGYIITKIVKITPSGQIKTEDGRTFKNGRCRVDSWTSYVLEEVTQAIRDSVLKQRLIYELSQVKWKDLPLSTLIDIQRLLPKAIEPNESTQAKPEAE